MPDDESRREVRSIPVPDPTVLTRESIDRDISALKELIATRLNAMDEAIRLARTGLERAPHDVSKAVMNLKDLHEEKFKTVQSLFDGVQIQFIERDVRVKESATARDTAVAAALQAQKEAAGEQTKSFTVSINKSEQATSEQIVQLRLYVEQAIRAINDKIDDLKGRVDRGEGVGSGHSVAVVEQRATVADQRASAGEIRAYIALGVTLVLAGLTVMGFILH